MIQIYDYPFSLDACILLLLYHTLSKYLRNIFSVAVIQGGMQYTRIRTAAILPSFLQTGMQQQRKHSPLVPKSFTAFRITARGRKAPCQ